ncbi:MAG: c-type cytochrome [Gammaproteobacteria bacterium]|nr:c-type cytochrome [Gammaproteobacteria bacterium]
MPDRDAMTAWRLVTASLALAAACGLPECATAAVPASAGESIYLQGVLGSGAPLVGNRTNGGASTQGADAACVNCHQRSGLGSTEGNTLIPPITGDNLFHGHAHSGSMHGNRSPYTPATLARAIREGVDPEGRTLSSLMPRYALDDADMAALVAYLKSLAVHRVPGVTPSELHLATIFTPDADPVKRRGVLDVLEHYVVEQNGSASANRRWQLHIWQLAGPATTWQAQLEHDLQSEPVFAVLSGLGGSNWGPVHEFCEQNAIPCLFPNVEVPIASDGDFYSLYFSRGVLLEAELIGTDLARLARDTQHLAIVQVYRAGDSGEAAAHVLTTRLREHGLSVRDRILAAGGTSGRGVAAALREAGKADALVLWLRPDDIAALGSPPVVRQVYLSGLMGGLEAIPLPASWRGLARLAYPFATPDHRGAQVNYPLGWFSLRKIPLVAAQVQVDTYVACGLMAEVGTHLADTYVRPYLIEQLQGMAEHHLVTGYYPHLTLGYRQQFASKGGYMARLTEEHGTVRVVADGDWIVP